MVCCVCFLRRRGNDPSTHRVTQSPTQTEKVLSERSVNCFRRRQFFHFHFSSRPVPRDVNKTISELRVSVPRYVATGTNVMILLSCSIASPGKGWHCKNSEYRRNDTATTRRSGITDEHEDTAAKGGCEVGIDGKKRVQTIKKTVLLSHFLSYLSIRRCVLGTLYPSFALGQFPTL